jgi:hypothetical protein
VKVWIEASNVVAWLSKPPQKIKILLLAKIGRIPLCVAYVPVSKLNEVQRMNTQTETTSFPNLSVLPLAIVGASIALLANMAVVSVPETGNKTMSYQELQCESLARTDASRSQSMLDSKAMREATDQALQLCLKDPVAFRNQLR